MKCKDCHVRSSRRIKIRGKTVRVDPCLTEVIQKINNETEYKTLGSCCGHSRYPMSIVVKDSEGVISDYISGKKYQEQEDFM